MKVLVVEDDNTIASQLEEHLKDSGLIPKLSFDGEDGHYEGETNQYDLIILDLGLPLMDGLTVLEKWRNADIQTPVIILTARNNKMDVVRGLELGADDYLTKPFDMEELIARVKSNIRRNKGQLSQQLTYKNITFDTLSGKIFVDGSLVKLTRTEFLMLQYLFMNQGKVISSTELAENVYDDFDHDSGIIARHIANIRKKIGADSIVTESNRGYCIPKN